MNRKALGKGINALIPDFEIGVHEPGVSDEQGVIQTRELLIDEISPNRFQPRKYFDDDKLEELVTSISENGILQPLAVRSLTKNKVELIAGERRLRASKLAGLSSIPCLVDQKEDQNALEAALIENLQREDLNAVEEARGYDRLKREFGLTQEDVAGATGKARSTIANSLRILTLPSNVLDLLSQGLLEKGHAKLLASLDSEKAIALAKQITASNLTVKEAQNLTSRKTKKNTPKTKPKDVLNIEQDMSEGFGHKIEIEAKNKKTGKVVIHYSTSEELENIISKLV